MIHRPSPSGPPSKYNGFLFAPICEEDNGTALSVLSALARVDIDPWEEAARLAAMPKALAEQALQAMLGVIPGKNWNASEKGTISARLIPLLPQGGDRKMSAPAEIATQRTGYWMLWVGFALAISLLSPHHPPAKTDLDNPVSGSEATPPGVAGSINNSHPNPVALSR